MKEWDDEQIQRWLENQGTEPDNDPDAVAPDDLGTYQLLFDALKKEPVNGLPYHFSATIETILIQQKRRSRAALWYAVLGVGAGFSLLLVGFLFIMPANQPYFQVLLTLSRYKWLLIFGLVSLLIIQILDQKLVKERQLTRLTS